MRRARKIKKNKEDVIDETVVGKNDSQTMQKTVVHAEGKWYSSRKPFIFFGLALLVQSQSPNSDLYINQIQNKIQFESDDFLGESN